jgi:hypothetical protein
MDRVHGQSERLRGIALTQRPSFSKEYVLKELDRLSSKIKVQIRLFIIGGLGLINFGLKEATKDVDVVIQSRRELYALTRGLRSLGYSSLGPPVISRPYKKSEASRILENSEGFRWDIFLNQICGALVLSKGMASRSTSFYGKGLLKASLASKEDLFLLKGITERKADLDDMRLLAESGLDWRIIEQECKDQSTSSGRLWESALLQNLIDLRERHNIRSPVEQTLRKVTEERLSEDELTRAVKKGCVTVKIISETTRLPQHWVREYAKKMEEKGLLRIDRSGHPHKFALVPRPKPMKPGR